MMENQSVFCLVTRLCEIFLNSNGHKDSSSSRTVHLKKLRTTAYEILLRPSETALPDNPHESFVSAISAHIQNVIEDEGNNTQEFDKCVEHLWSESTKRPYLASVVYFLSKLHNENLFLNGESQIMSRGDGIHSEFGFTSSSLPKQYRVYHPSMFTLPKLEDFAVRESTFISSTSTSAFLPNESMLLPPMGLQLNFANKKEKTQRKGLSNQLKPFLHHSKTVVDDHNHQLEDEGYVSHGATPLGVSPGGWCGMPWDEIGILEEKWEQRRDRTWEALGEPSPVCELPTLMEAGVKALHCQLKIQESLLLTLEPSLWSPPTSPTSWPSFFQQIMYLIIGVESSCFSFNKNLDAFELVSGTWVEGLSHEALALYTDDFLVMGTCLRRLFSIMTPSSSLDVVDGVVQLAIRKSLKTYLNFYSGACMVVMQNILKQSSLSFLLVKSKIRVLQMQIIGLARAFGKWGSGNNIPDGVAALGHLYRHALGAQRKELVYLLRYILNSACCAYFNLLERWVYNGEVVGERDFFVSARTEYISHRSRRYWTRAFTLNSAVLPEFLCGLESILLRCGKSVHFLKLCDPRNPVLEESLKRMTSEQTISQHENEVEPTINMKQIETVANSMSLDLMEKSNADDQHQDSQDELPDAEEISATPEMLSVENPVEDAMHINEKTLQEGASEELEKVSSDPRTSEEELRFQAVKETIIEEYAKSFDAVDKRHMRADWRVRRLKLRTQKISPTETIPTPPETSSTDLQASQVSVPRNLSSNKNADEVICDDNLEGMLKEERNAGIENISVLPLDAVDIKVDNNVIDPTPPNNDSSNEVSGLLNSDEGIIAGDLVMREKGGENLDGESDKSNDLLSIIESSGNLKVPKHEELSPDVGSTEISSMKEPEKDGNHNSVGSEETNNSKESVNVPMKEIKTSVEPEIQTEICAEKDEFFSSLITFPPSSTSLSPRRTPLKKVDGLFSFPSVPDGRAEKELMEAGEAEQLDWPFWPVLVSLTSHSRKVDAALLRWLLVDKGLISHLHSIRSYFFLLDGEFGRRLSVDLFSAMRHKPGKKPSVESLNSVMLNGILSQALASSTHAVSDPNANLLSMILREYPAQASVFEQLGSIQMVYDAPWPVNVVLTEEALSKYSRVFDLLLRLKSASWALEEVFMHMRTIDPTKGNKQAFASGSRSSSEAYQHSPQFRTLHIYRHQMLNLIKSVQSYITAEVLQASGKKLEEAIAHASCLDEFYSEHVSYVKRILFECLLNKRSETISSILNDIVKLIMKFHWSLCSRSWIITHDQGNSENFTLIHPNFSVLSRIYEAFKDMTDFLLKYFWRLANHGYQAHLSTLLLMVNANNFYTPENV